MAVRKLSQRKCPFCSTGSATDDIFVNPYYSYKVKCISNPIEIGFISIIAITEKFVCPVCGRVLENSYDVKLGHNTMQEIIDDINDRSR